VSVEPKNGIHFSANGTKGIEIGKLDMSSTSVDSWKSACTQSRRSSVAARIKTSNLGWSK